MFVAKNENSNLPDFINNTKIITIIKLIELRVFRIIYNEEIHIATIFDDNVIYINGKGYVSVEFVENILFIYGEPVNIAHDYSVVNSIPEWWPPNVVWPPSLKSLQYSNISISEFKTSLRYSNSWNTVFIKNTGDNFTCACGQNCSKKYNCSYLLKDSNDGIKYSLSGKYDYFIEDLKKLSKKKIVYVLKLFYIDQACLWRKVMMIESRIKKKQMKSIWLRCCIDTINTEIYKCLQLLNNIGDKNKCSV
tara:strand:- start:429 stop:1175 length:747 start_codon:yes stop_codon:yes gene_type:complete